MAKETIGSTLKRLRDQTKMSVKEVLGQLSEMDFDISDKTLYSYESGKRMPSGDMLISLCKIYNCKNMLLEFEDVDDSDDSIPDDGEWALIEKYRRISPEGQEMVKTVLDQEYDRMDAFDFRLVEFRKLLDKIDDISKEDVMLLLTDDEKAKEVKERLLAESSKND